MPRLTTRLKLSLPLSNEYVQREVLVKAFEEIDRLVMLQGDLDELKRAVNKYTDDSIKTLKDETENKVGKPNGIAGLDKEGKVPTTQLPKREAKDVNLADAKGYYSEKTVEFALQQVGADLAETDKKSQLLQQGLNVLNAPVASSLSVEIQGRTLVNLLGQTNLDNTKYYVFIPQKGTTKILYGGNTYEGVTRFTGQATVSYSIKQDFRGKVAGNVVENGNISKVGFGNSLLNPTNLNNFPFEVEYDRINTLNGVYKTSNTISDGQFPQNVFSFNIIRTLEDKFGPQIWQGKTTLAEKVAIAKQIVTKIACNWWGFGSGANGNKATLNRWVGTGYAVGVSHNNGTVTKLSYSAGGALVELQSDGFVYFLASAEPSNGTVASVINTDYVELELEVNTSLPLLEDALYEVDQATYNKINVDPEYSGQKLLDKFPYVQGVQHLNPVVVAEGGNLLPPFTEWELHKDATIINPYELMVKTPGGQVNNKCEIPLIPGQAYYFYYKDSSHVRYDIQTLDKDKKLIRTIASWTLNEVVINVQSNEVMARVNAYNYPVVDAGTFTFESPLLTMKKGSKFTPRNPSYLYTNTVLVGQNGVNDVLHQEDGQWKVLRKWERDVVLDGTKNWFNVVNKEGFKIFGYTIEQSTVAQSPITQKPTGLFMKREYNWNVPDTSYIDDGKVVTLTIPNVESGYSQDYVPVLEEIKAYFNGWKVKTTDANGKPIAWKSVVDDKDAPTQTLAYVKANRAPNYTPYKLTYQLATPRVENVQVEGDLAVRGMTQVSVDSGVVVRERVVPQTATGQPGVYYINGQTNPANPLKNKLKDMVAIYKNGVKDNMWTRYASTSAAWGTESANYDPTAEYTVTYLVQDKHQFTTNPIDVKATYNQSLKTSVTELVEKQADTATGLSILVNATSENTKDIVALKKATADNTTDITELKNKMNTNSNKLDKHLESLSRFRSNKDDNGIFRTIEWKTKSGILRRKAIITVSATTGDYDKQTVAEYADDGKTITKIDEYKLILDGDGDIVNEVLQ